MLLGGYMGKRTEKKMVNEQKNGAPFESAKKTILLLSE